MSNPIISGYYADPDIRTEFVGQSTDKSDPAPSLFV